MMKIFFTLSLFFCFATNIYSESMIPWEEFTFTRKDLELGCLLRDGYKIRYKVDPEINDFDLTMHCIGLAHRMQKCAQNPTDECNWFHLDEMEENLKHFPESEATKTVYGIIEILKAAKTKTAQ